MARTFTPRFEQVGPLVLLDAGGLDRGQRQLVRRHEAQAQDFCQGSRQQVLGDDQDGGVLFEKLAPTGKAPMFNVGKEGVIGKKPCSAHEAVLLQRYSKTMRCGSRQTSG